MILSCLLGSVLLAAPVEPFLPASNPFAAPSTLPFQLPPFDQIHDEDFGPAFEAGMAEQLSEVRAIAGNPDAPTFENTIVALERSGQLLNRVNLVFSNLTSANTNPALEKLQAELAPRLSAHRDAIWMDDALYARVQKLYAARRGLGLDAESQRLLERYHTLFARAGAPLSPEAKSQLQALNARLSTLATEFQQNVLQATNDGAVVVDDVKQLDGLSPQQLAAAARAAIDRKLSGKWVIALQSTTRQPVLANLTDRALRERIYRASVGRASSGTRADNTQVIAEIVKLRAQRAKLLGYRSHAAYVIEDQGARTPEAVDQLLRSLAPAAVASARREAAEIQKAIDAEAKAGHGKPFQLAPWDWAFYSEKVRKAKYDYGESEVRAYFELDRVLKDGVFFAAEKLYGVRLKERRDLPLYHPDVRVFDVFDADGKRLGLFLGDFFARENKLGGAWMDNYVNQSQLLGQQPVVVNCLNIPRPLRGQPALLTFDEVKSLFHEFGHALHGLLSQVKYPLLSGISAPSDFVEFPPQYAELWATDPEVLAHYARHHQTGAAMPAALVKKVLAAKSFGEGFAMLEYLESAAFDLKWHQLTAAEAPDAKAVAAFEEAALKKNGLALAPVPPQYRSPYFVHIFSEDYSAGFYAYAWASLLAADADHWMKLHGGLSRSNGDFLRARVLARGFTEEPSKLFKAFYGSEPDIGPLLEAHGLALPHSAKQ